LSPLEIQKSRGAFFTPPEITRFLTEWAIRMPTDSVLEPSCGDAAFLLPAAAKLASLGTSQPAIASQLCGVEIHAPSIAQARARLEDRGYSARIIEADFFDSEPDTKFDAVIGNPPYVRYQDFSGTARAKSLRAALAQGVRLKGLASSWAAFTVHASEFLKDDGRLGLVLPAELLSVNYAAEVRTFLLNRFSKVRLVLFQNLVFPGVLEEVVLLLAEGRGSAKSFEVFQAKDLDALEQLAASTSHEFTPHEGEKWTPAFLPSSSLVTYRDVVRRAGFNKLVDWGSTYLGSVTGNNNYFTLTEEDARRLRFKNGDLIRISPPGSRHLRGLTFTDKAWEQMARAGGRCYLFFPRTNRLSAAAKALIEAGEKKGIDNAYKCTARSPWWRVPQVSCPDLLFTYMNHDRPRLITNEAGVAILNSLYGVTLKTKLRVIGKKYLPIACLNSVTLLGSEIVGRAYGGGLLKHEPREADLLPVPSLEAIQAIAAKLSLVRPQLSIALRANDLASAVEMVDRILLTEHMGLPSKDIDNLRSAREIFFNRRLARARGDRGEN
jgi:adenine-specific DNA-methyltransferase